MIDNLPLLISLAFGLTTFATVGLFFWALRNSASEKTRKNSIKILLAIVLWMGVQAVLALSDTYNSNLDVLPPKLVIFGILPAVIALIVLFATRSGRNFIDKLPLLQLTYLHVIRIPVELGLFSLFMNNAIPEVMTFEGRNFDIIAGITAPLVAYFGLKKGKIGPKAIIAWNFISLALLINIVVHATLSIPYPTQMIAFDQPNIALLHFPFNWLPTCVVPLVLFAHLVSIRQLFTVKETVSVEK